MSTPCSMAGGRSIGSSEGARPCSAAGDCHGCPCGAGRAIHGSATAAGGGGGGTAPGTGQLPLNCASAAAGTVSALSASRICFLVTLPQIGTKTERLQNQPLIGWGLLAFERQSVLLARRSAEILRDAVHFLVAGQRRQLLARGERVVVAARAGAGN